MNNTLPPYARVAIEDKEFLLDPSARSLRFALECMRAEEMFTRARVRDVVTIFGSARISGNDPHHPLNEWYEKTRLLSGCIARRFTYRETTTGMWRNVICTGGGPGIMQAANQGANQAGKPNAGLCIALPWETQPNPFISSELAMTFYYFHIRKFQMVARANAVIAMPGGFGTLDEVFEALTLLQTNKSHRFPLILMGRSFWSDLMDISYLARTGVISQEDVALPIICDEVEEAMDALSKYLPLPS